MKSYDPSQPPDPKAWNELDEFEQIDLVMKYHRKLKIELPDERLHALAHSIVETQVSLGRETPVAATIDRLIGEGLSRHDALHAVGGVLMGLMWEIGQGTITSDVNAAYYAELQELTAEKWLAQAEEG